MQQIFFDPKRRTNARKRAAARSGIDSNFLHLEAAQIIAERLSVTNRQFSNCAILFDHPFSAQIQTMIVAALPGLADKISVVSFPENDRQHPSYGEKLNLPPQSIDLAVSVFDLHWMNDLPGMLVQINHALKPDGLFMAVLPGQATLNELRACLIEAEINVRSGASMRVDAFPQIRQLGDLLGRTGFKLPVADAEQRVIRYSSAKKLVSDLRNTGATSMTGLKHPALTKKIWNNALAIYSDRHSDGDGKLRAEIEFVFISGWKEHDSQQKPLTPGSAKEKLSDFL